MSLLFASYLLFAPGYPAARYFARRQPAALIPYIPRTLACCKASQFRLRSDATRAAIDRFLWCHPSTQNGHTRHLVATKVGAVVFATSRRKRRGTWVRNGAERSRLSLIRPSRSLLRAPPGTRERVSRPGGRSRTLCRTVAVHSIRLCSRRRTVTIATTVGAVRSVGGGRGRCVPHRLFVVLQHLGHCCLHGPACFLALLAQLTAQSQGGCPG